MTFRGLLTIHFVYDTIFLYVFFQLKYFKKISNNYAWKENPDFFVYDKPKFEACVYCIRKRTDRQKHHFRIKSSQQLQSVTTNQKHHGHNDQHRNNLINQQHNGCR